MNTSAQSQPEPRFGSPNWVSHEWTPNGSGTHRCVHCGRIAKLSSDQALLYTDEEREHCGIRASKLKQEIFDEMVSMKPASAVVCIMAAGLLFIFVALIYWIFRVL